MCHHLHPPQIGLDLLSTFDPEKVMVNSKAGYCQKQCNGLAMTSTK